MFKSGCENCGAKKILSGSTGREKTTSGICRQIITYSIYSKYSDRTEQIRNLGPDQMPQNVASDLGLHCLPLTKQFLAIDRY